VSKLQILAVILVVFDPRDTVADQIGLKNGDRLTGSIEKSDNRALVIKTDRR
jgi:hypothetical protein